LETVIQGVEVGDPQVEGRGLSRRNLGRREEGRGGRRREELVA